MITLIVGSTGAGKTTYARKLAQQIRAVVYSIDDWMKALYWQDMPAKPDMKWFQENGQWYRDRISRCEDMIFQEVVSRAKLNEKSILDLGFSTLEHRKQFIERFQKLGYKVDVHYVKVDQQVRWQRVQQRNQQKGDTFVMDVDQGMFDFMESIFQPPDSSEGADVFDIE